VALLAGTGSAQIIPDPVTHVFWVHPDRGSDSDPGTQADPWKTLTHALLEAAALRNTLEQTPPAPPPAVNPFWLIRIQVQSSATPIAPLDYGGHEPEFPIRLERRVDVLGVNSAIHGKARILIDDEAAPTVYPWPSIPATDGSGARAFVYGAKDCTLQNFRIDGTTLRHKFQFYSSAGESKKKPVYGVHTVDKTNFHLKDCGLLEQYNGASWSATSGGTCSGTVSGCSFQDYFPFPALPPADPLLSEGHGGLWLEGQNGFVPAPPPDPGEPDGITRVSVQVFNSGFTDCHDGIEILGPKMAPEEVSRFEAVLTVDGCVFEDNENGIEVVGKGRLDASVTASLFRGNIPLEDLGGTSQHVVTGGIVVRGMEIVGRVRESVFVNNGAGVLWNPSTATSCLDLGHAAGETETACFGAGVPTTATPGLNVFDIDYTDWDPARDAYTVLLLSRTGVTTVPVHAAGNTWLSGVQGADTNGCLSGEFTGPFNFPPPHWSNPSLADRNFSIMQTDARIRFGPSCP